VLWLPGNRFDAPDFGKPISKNKRANIIKLSGFFAKHFSLFFLFFDMIFHVNR
jgi:hypothetical protein